MIIDEEGVIELVRIVGGEDAAKIAQKLMKKPGLTDDELAVTLEMDVKHVRKILHILHDLSLLTYEMAFDKKNNRRVFKWRLQQEQVIGVVKAQLKKIYARLKMLREHFGKNQFYWCGNVSCKKYTFDAALDNFFKCPTCGQKLNYFDPTPIISAIDRKISEIEKMLS